MHPRIGMIPASHGMSMNLLHCACLLRQYGPLISGFTMSKGPYIIDLLIIINNIYNVLKMAYLCIFINVQFHSMESRNQFQCSNCWINPSSPFFFISPSSFSSSSTSRSSSYLYWDSYWCSCSSSSIPPLPLLFIFHLYIILLLLRTLLQHHVYHAIHPFVLHILLVYSMRDSLDKWDAMYHSLEQL